MPGVGWIFTPRLPIRGPKSRAATAEAKAKKDPDSAPAKAAELARAAKKAAKRSSKARKASQPAPSVDTSWPITPATPPPARAKLDPVFSSAVEEAVEEALHPPKPQKSRDVAKKHATAKKSAPQKSAKAKKDAPARKQRDGKGPAAGAERGRSGGRTPEEEAGHPAAGGQRAAGLHQFRCRLRSRQHGGAARWSRSPRTAPWSTCRSPAVGCCTATSRLTAMGTPPPTKARQVLKKGEVRPFVLAGLDPPRRVAELALPSGTPEKQRARQEGARPQEVRRQEGDRRRRCCRAGQEGRSEEGRRAGEEGHRKEGSGTGQEGCGQEGCGQEGCGQEGCGQEGCGQGEKAPAKKAAKASKAPAKKAAKASHR